MSNKEKPRHFSGWRGLEKCFYFRLERETRHNLARPGIGASTVERVDESVAGRVGTTRVVFRGGRSRVYVTRPAYARRGQRNAIEDVLELGTNVEIDLAFLRQPEVPSEVHGFLGLTLPPEVVVVGGP